MEHTWYRGSLTQTEGGKHAGEDIFRIDATSDGAQGIERGTEVNIHKLGGFAGEQSRACGSQEIERLLQGMAVAGVDGRQGIALSGIAKEELFPLRWRSICG